MITSPPESLAKFIYCCSMLEEKVARAYEQMAKLINNEAIASLLSFIAHDSLKHADFLRRVSKLLCNDIEANSDECEKTLGKIWKSIIMDAERVLNKSEIEPKDIANVIENLKRIEGFAAEEYLTTLQIKLVELMIGDLKINIDHLKVLLEWIVEDEKRHESILKIVENLL